MRIVALRGLGMEFSIREGGLVGETQGGRYAGRVLGEWDIHFTE